MIDDTEPSGYLSETYARSFAAFGKPRHLTGSGAWLLERPIPGHASARDAMGLYPLFCCRDWTALARDLDRLADEVVCVSLVADPWGEYDQSMLQACFSDLCVPFKTHYVTDLTIDPQLTVSKHHRYYVRQSRRTLHVESVDPAGFGAIWSDLYGHLARRHGLTGLKAFSPDSLRAQLQVPGTTVLAAFDGAEVVAAHVWYRQGDVVHSHLAASSPRGYELMAAYAIYWQALLHFRGDATWLALGGAAGAADYASDGLARFKKGWSTAQRPSYLCGRILQRETYAQLAAACAPASYFPIYRNGELL